MAEFLSAQELADYLDVSAATVRNWARNGDIPFYRVPGRGGKRGGQFVFRLADVMRVMNNPIEYEERDED